MNTVNLRNPVQKLLPGGCLLVAIIIGFPLESAEVQATEEDPVMLEQEPLMIPYDLWDVTHTWEDGQILARVNSDGTVEDWIPLNLPHNRLIPVLDECLISTKFRPAMVDGKPIACDVRMKVPLRGAGNYGISIQSMGDHIQSMLATMGWSPDRLFISTPDKLDSPLEIVDRGKAYVPTDEAGNLLDGTVNVEFYIDVDGKPRMLRVLDTQNPIMADAAYQTVSGFRFSPPRQSGEPTVVKARIPVVVASK